MSATLNLVLHLAVILGPLLAVMSIGPSVDSIKARLKLAAWLASFAGLCAWLLCGYCGPHPFLTMDGGPMPPDLVLVLTAGTVFTGAAIVAVFVRKAIKT
jgi:hypothetical protein